MTDLAAYQDQLFSSLIERPAEELVSAIDAADPTEAELRLAVYRNNYAHGMTQVLQDAYPVILRLVGNDFFAALAKEYARQHPPTQASMQRYGEQFPRLLAEHPACAELPFLEDVALIEQYYIRCFHGPDVAPINLNHLLAHDEELLPKAQFSQHPNVYLLASVHPALDIWYANLDDEVAELDLSALSPSRVLIYRNVDYRVETVQLTEIAFKFCQLLMNDHCIERAWQALQTNISEPLDDEELNGMLTYFLGLGIFSGLTIQQE